MIKCYKFYETIKFIIEMIRDAHRILCCSNEASDCVDNVNKIQLSNRLNSA